MYGGFLGSIPRLFQIKVTTIPFTEPTALDRTAFRADSTSRSATCHYAGLIDKTSLSE
jgi:hypothetical protein